jgi:hypothetical protein
VNSTRSFHTDWAGDEMTRNEAKDLLLFHSFSHSEAPHDPRAASGFLGSLRPYRGRLDPSNLHEVMAALVTLASEFEQSELDREIVHALWSITHLARAWGLEPEGMLRSNRLISDDDIATLTAWVEAISYATWCLLDGVGIDEALEPYRQLQSI